MCCPRIFNPHLYHADLSYVSIFSSFIINALILLFTDCDSKSLIEAVYEMTHVNFYICYLIQLSFFQGIDSIKCE